MVSPIEPLDADVLAPLGPGWRRLEVPTPLWFEGGFAAERVASGGGILLVLCQAMSPGTLPTPRARLRIRRRIEERVGDVVVLFSDVMRTTAVWSLPLQAGSIGAAEFHLPGRESELVAALEELLTSRAGRHLLPHEEARLATLISGRLPLCPSGAATLSEFATWAHRRAPPGGAQRCWNVLTRLTLLDPSCSEGEWLVAAGNTLLPLHIALVHRIRADTDDPVESYTPGQDAREAARALLDGVRACGGSVDLFVRRALCRRNLHGVAGTPAEARVARRRLAEFGRLAVDARTPLDLRVRVVADEEGQCIPPPEAEREGWILGRARALLDPYRGAQPGADSGFRRSALALERRERRWARGAGTLWADRRGAFDFVREA